MVFLIKTKIIILNYRLKKLHLIKIFRFHYRILISRIILLYKK